MQYDQQRSTSRWRWRFQTPTCHNCSQVAPCGALWWSKISLASYRSTCCPLVTSPEVAILRVPRKMRSRFATRSRPNRLFLSGRMLTKIVDFFQPGLQKVFSPLRGVYMGCRRLKNNFLVPFSSVHVLLILLPRIVPAFFPLTTIMNW